MHNFFYTILFALLIVIIPSDSQSLTDVDRQELVSKNILAPWNPGFESGVANWTASGGSVAHVTAGSNLLIGKGSATWDASAASQTWRSKLVTIPKGLYGASGMIRCKAQTPSGISTHKFQVFDGTNVIAERNIISSTFPLNQTLNFLFPSSGSLQIQLTSSADEPLISLDDCYMGAATNLSEVSQAEFWGSQVVPGAASCIQIMSSSLFTNVPADADCGTPVLTGYADTTAGKRPAISFPSLPPGTYQVIARVTADTTAGDAGCNWRISDGTTNGSATVTYSPGNVVHNIVVSNKFTYTTAQSAKVFSLQVANSTGAGDCTVRAINSGGSSEDYTLEVYKFPTSSQTVYTPEMYNWRVDASLTSPGAMVLDTGAVSSYKPIADASLTLQNYPGALDAKIPCSGSNPPTGTTCAAGNENIGVNFDVPVAGDVKACVSFTHRFAHTSTGNSQPTWQIVETPNNAETVIQEGGERIKTGSILVGAIDLLQFRQTKICGTFRFSTAGNKTLRLMYEKPANTGANQDYVQATNNASEGNDNIRWEVWPITQVTPVPIYAGSSISGIEYVCNTAMGNVDDTSSFSYSEDGCDFPQVPYSAGGRIKRIRFLNTPKSSDTIQFQVRASSTNSQWITLDSNSVGITMPIAIQNGVYYGAGRIGSIGTPYTDFDVLFGQYRYNTGATYGSAGTDWSGAMAGFKWRVVKYSNAIPVNSQVTGYVYAYPVASSNTRVEFGYAYTTSPGTACSSSPCVLARNTNGVTSVTRAGLGDYTINFSPAFSDVPVCTALTDGGYRLVIQNTATASSFRINTATGTIAAPAGTDAAFSFHCIGPK